MPEKNLADNFRDGYWLNIITLLKIGLPWELVMKADDTDMVHILATVQALHDYEQEVRDREARQQYQTMK